MSRRERKRQEKVVNALFAQISKNGPPFADDKIIDSLFAFFEKSDGFYAAHFAVPLNDEETEQKIDEKQKQKPSGKTMFTYALVEGWPIALLFPDTGASLELGNLSDIRKNLQSRWGAPHEGDTSPARWMTSHSERPEYKWPTVQ